MQGWALGIYEGVRRGNLQHELAIVVVHSSSTALEVLSSQETRLEALSRTSSAFRGATEHLRLSIVVNGRSNWTGELESRKTNLVAS